MAFKKIGLILALLIFSIMSVNAVTTLNNCGAVVWVNGESYLINITTIDNSYGSNICFTINGAYASGLKFNQTTSLINITKTGDFYFFYDSDNGANSNMVWNNFNVKDSANNGNKRFLSGVGAFPSSASTSGTMSNITLQNFKYFTEGNEKYTGSFTIDNLNLYNVHYSYINTFNYLNSLISMGINDGVWFGNQTLVNYNYQSWNNSILMELNSYGTNVPLFKDRTIDNIDYRFLLDYANSTSSSSFSKVNVFLNGGNVGSPTTISVRNILDLGFVTTNMTQALAFTDTLVGAEINCGFLSNKKCNIYNSPTTTSSSGIYYFNYIDMASSTKLLNANFNISHDNFTGSVSASILGNSNDVTYSDIDIKNNIFYSTGNILLDMNVTLSRPFIKLKANGIEMENNNFTYSFPTNIGQGEFLNIIADNSQNNKITLNRFTNNVSTPLVKSEIGHFNLYSKFYNNYVGNNVVLSTNTEATIGIIPTAYIGYNHTDGYIYYYNIGNYYQENVGCVDANVDGFCDSSYTSGNVTDTHPLSSYPFIFTNHLLTYENRVLNDGFNITLSEPNDNQTFSFTNANEIITFGFSQNSDFDDLICSFIIDGSNVFNTNYFVDKNLIYTEDFTTWTNGSHSYRVECGNEFQYIISDEINFNVIISVDGGNGGGGNGGGGDGTGTGIIDVTDTQATADNVVAFAGSTLDAIMSFFSPFAMFFIIIVAILGIAVFLGA